MNPINIVDKGLEKIEQDPTEGLWLISARTTPSKSFAWADATRRWSQYPYQIP